MFDPVLLELLWTRLISIVDEAAAALLRTSFSTVVRESHDFGCVLTDAEGRSVVQATDSVPSFLCTLPHTIRHFLREYPPQTLSPGDMLITNDIWMGTGHLPDITVAKPIFAEAAAGRLRRLGRAFAGHRRPHPLGRGARRLRGRAADPAHEGRDGGRAGRDADAPAPPQHPRARPGAGRPLRAVRRARPDGAARPGAAGGAPAARPLRPREGDPGALGTRHARGDRRRAGRHLPRRGLDRRAGRAAAPPPRADRRGRLHRLRLRRLARPGAAGDQRLPRLHLRLHGLRGEGGALPRRAEQRGQLRAADGDGARRLHPQLAPPGGRRGAGADRALPARAGPLGAGARRCPTAWWPASARRSGASTSPACARTGRRSPTRCSSTAATAPAPRATARTCCLALQRLLRLRRDDRAVRPLARALPPPARGRGRRRQVPRRHRAGNPLREPLLPPRSRSPSWPSARGPTPRPRASPAGSRARRAPCW